jgi:SAM-dependent methyltransferase
MTSIARIIESPTWLESPAGRYLLAWEQAQLDRLVADIFGFHALQLGRPALDGLRSNRMPHRWLANDVPWQPALPASSTASGWGASIGARPDPALRPLDLLTNFEALPLPSQSLDLVVLPHTLELADDAHQTLREVERVLMPEGRVVVIGFNPASLWGLGGRCQRAGASLGLRTSQGQALEHIGPRRLRDWFKLLGLQVETGSFGCWRPPWTGERWLERNQWMEQAGERWWPFFGSVYAVVAVKRVRALRLIGPTWKQRRKVAGAPAVLTPQRRASDLHHRLAGAETPGSPGPGRAPALADTAAFAAPQPPLAHAHAPGSTFTR